MLPSSPTQSRATFPAQTSCKCMSRAHTRKITNFSLAAQCCKIFTNAAWHYLRLDCRAPNRAPLACCQARRHSRAPLFMPEPAANACRMHTRTQSRSKNDRHVTGWHDQHVHLLTRLVSTKPWRLSSALAVSVDEHLAQGGCSDGRGIGYEGLRTSSVSQLKLPSCVLEYGCYNLK